MTTSPVWAPKCTRLCLAVDQVTSSAGADSTPISGINMLPDCFAALSYFLIILATKGTSPVTSR